MQVIYYIKTQQGNFRFTTMPTNDIDAWTAFKEHPSSGQGPRTLIKELKTELYSD